MTKLIYRVVAANSNLGYGIPRDSFTAALEGQVDAIVCDAGTALDGPTHLGQGTGYFAPQQIKSDLLKMVGAARRIGCPVIIGSAGLAGGDRHIATTLKLFAEVFEDLGIKNARVATISAELKAERVILEAHRGNLLPLGKGILLDEQNLRDSTIVAQMGVHPIITALTEGAQYVIAGRACDASLFAADMIRRGIAAGLAYHAGHLLECGALACEPPSPADTLVCEIYDDGTAFFIAPNTERRCTVHSIAAHSLYATPHPHIQIFPEGLLDTKPTRYYGRDERVAGVSGARFLSGSARLDVKLEGSRRLGYRKFSLLRIHPSDLESIPQDMLAYGRNGVQFFSHPHATRENGVLIETTAATLDSATLLAVALADQLRLFSYPGRRRSTGNLAHPITPQGLGFKRSNGTFGALVLGGTTDPQFIELLPRIEIAIVAQLEATMPQAFAYANYEISTLDAKAPAVVITTVDRDSERLKDRHAAEISRVTSVAAIEPNSLVDIDAPDAYEWSLFHVLRDDQMIREEFFPITLYEVSGRDWQATKTCLPVYTDLTEINLSPGEDPSSHSMIEDAEPRGVVLGSQRLVDMASVIRSANCGVNRLTFDVFFMSAEAYEAALRSNRFFRENIAITLGMEFEHVLGTYFADSCNAIKLTIDRPVAGGPDERDLYGEQQQAILEDLQIPIYSPELPAFA
jgi:Domain of unknown function (DUF4387)/Acyclic terpene utilisation family protein AtuA